MRVEDLEVMGVAPSTEAAFYGRITSAVIDSILFLRDATRGVRQSESRVIGVSCRDSIPTTMGRLRELRNVQKHFARKEADSKQ